MPRIDRSPNLGKTNTEKSTRTPADQLHPEPAQQSPQDQYRQVTSEVIRQSLLQPERAPQKRTPHQSARSNESLSALRSLRAIPGGGATDENANPESQRNAPVLLEANHTDQHGSGQNDDGDELIRELVSTTREIGETCASYVETICITNDEESGAARPSLAILRSPAATVQKVPKLCSPGLRSQSGAVLVEELLNTYVQSLDTPPRFSQNRSHLALPKAGLKEKRRIQKAFAVTDSINIVAVRISQNNSNQHQTRSLLDALIDLLYLLVDLLSPVMNLIDPAAKRTARAQLVQLAFMTPYFGRLKVACEAAASLFDDDSNS
jgi:hypothetical protein